MRIVIAPDKFKGSLTAAEAAAAMAEGARRMFPEATINLRPMGDGGEGSLDAVLTAVGGRSRSTTVTGPLGAPVEAAIARLNSGPVAVEMAQASGLGVSGDEPDALAASSVGLGELVGRALEETDPAELIVFVGGSASSDGGTGAARALGWRFLDSEGNDLPLGGGALVDLARIDGGGVSEALRGNAVSIVGACDVDAPLTGSRGAARLLGPQMGADADAIQILERGLQNLSERIRADVGIDVDALPFAGAGGGMGAGLAVFFGAELVSGFDLIQRMSDLKELIAGADLVLTGEGRLDTQSLRGKTPIAVGHLARAAKVKCIAVAGRVTLQTKELKKNGIRATISLLDGGRAAEAKSAPATATADATERVLRRVYEPKKDPDRRTQRRSFFGGHG